MAAPLRTLSLAGSSLLGIALMLPAAVRGADGLTVPDSSLTWPRWQLRLSLIEVPITRWSLSEHPDLAQPRRAALLGDYDLGTFGLKLPFAQGRFRATSGLLFGLRRGTTIDLTTPWAPYVGLGWTGSVPKTGLSFSADLGLSANGDSWRLGDARLGVQGFDGSLRDLRLQPRLQLGVQYSY